MRILFVSALVALLALGACTSKQHSQTTIDYTQLVNPFIGTDFTGNTYPGKILNQHGRDHGNRSK